MNEEEPRLLLLSAMATLRMNKEVCLNGYDIEFVCTELIIKSIV